MATDAEIMALCAALQSWREPTDTAELIELARRYRWRFCKTCADWHEETETHSTTDTDKG